MMICNTKIKNMKRISLITMLVLITIMVSAQTKGGEINRKPKVENNKKQSYHSGVHRGTTPTSQNGIRRIVDGITLGKTTKQEVISILKKKGMKYSLQNINGIPIIEIDEYNTFGGNSWQHIFYYLYNNIVFQIDFSKEIKNGGDKTSIDLEYSNIEMSLIKKYGEYREKGSSDQDYYTTVFNDKLTEVRMAKGNYQGYYHFSLSYCDLELYKKVYDERVNDL